MSFVGKAASKDAKMIEKIRQMYITKKFIPKLTHKDLTEKELETAVTTFKYFDKNKDKHWDLPEFREYIKWSTNYGISRDKIDNLFNSIDTNRDDLLSMTEFMDYGSLKKKQLPSETNLENLFSTCDLNEDGLIGLEEFRHALLLLGEDLGRYNNLRAAFARYDKDKDGLINVYEFMRFVKSETARSKG